MKRFWAGIAAGTGIMAFATAIGIVLALTDRIPLPRFLGGGTVLPENAIDVISERLLSQWE